MREWRAWATIVNDGAPGADRIYLIDSNREAVKRPFGKTIRILITEVPMRHRGRSFKRKHGTIKR